MATTIPVFLLGVAPRSGTNYLEDTLCTHPDISVGLPLREDHLLRHVRSLVQYIESVRHTYAVKARVAPWGAPALEKADELPSAIGKGILDFIVAQVDERRRFSEPAENMSLEKRLFKYCPRYIVAKTPFPTNLSHFRRFFPDSPLILLMRDGRSVAESLMKTRADSLEAAAGVWIRGARTIAQFIDSDRDRRHLFVRYEDLVREPREGFGKILSYLSVDPAAFDFDAATTRPIRGSSETKRDHGEVHWRPVARDATFDPVHRWRSWSADQHARFNYLSGDLLERFGYEPVNTRGLRSASLFQQSLDLTQWCVGKLRPQTISTDDDGVRL